MRIESVALRLQLIFIDTPWSDIVGIHHVLWDTVYPVCRLDVIHLAHVPTSMFVPICHSGLLADGVCMQESTEPFQHMITALSHGAPPHGITTVTVVSIFCVGNRW